MVITEYTLTNSTISAGKVFALVSDLHSEDPAEKIKVLREMKPDYILAPGDIMEVMDGSCDEENENGFDFLSECAGIAPTFYSLGNHEMGATGSWRRMDGKKAMQEKKISERNAERLKKTGVMFLDDSFVVYDGMAFFGLRSGLVCDGHIPRLETMTEFMKCQCPKILLSHHPEYYPKYFKDMPLDLIVSGHAHGGQWRFFGRGFLAPGQGFFPKYTSGMHGGNFVIGRGLKTHSWAPRIFNPPEIVKIMS